MYISANTAWKNKFVKGYLSCYFGDYFRDYFRDYFGDHFGNYLGNYLGDYLVDYFGSNFGGELVEIFLDILDTLKKKFNPEAGAKKHRVSFFF